MMSFEECQKWGKRRREEEKRMQDKMEQIRMDRLAKMGIDPDNKASINPRYDHPCMPEDGTITFLYIVAMIGSMIFKDFWIAWIILTIAYGNFITRHDND